jgi:hypothetical protein
MSATMYYPGEVYEIDRDCSLASLKVGARYVFEFDRNAGKTDAGETVISDYTCKKCGNPFKTLAELGRHSNSDHKNEPDALLAELTDGAPVDAPVVLERRGCKPGRTFTCKVPGCGKVMANLYATRIHKKEHEKALIAEAEAAQTEPVSA